MRRFLSLLLTLALLSALGMTALAEAPEDGVGIAIPEADDIPSIDDFPEAEGPALSLDGDALLLQDVPAALAEAPEAIDENASVPAKLTLGVGESYSLKVSGAKKYNSSEKACATVSSRGVIKGKSVGSAKITVTMKDGSTLEVRVTVKAAPKSVKLNKAKLTLVAGKTYQLKATLSSKSASKLTWSSNKKSVARVDGSGLVTAVKAGTAVITVKTFNKKAATCTVTVKAPPRKVGISMPTDMLMRWENDGANMKRLLKKAGYTVDLEYADNDMATQVSQIKAMIKDGCDALIIAPIEAYSLTDVLRAAADRDIPVLAYDRLLMDTDAVTCYVTFDNYQVGVVQANYIRDALKLDSAKGPFNIEFTAGDPSDRNASVFYQGAIDVLTPYVKSGKLKVLSGQSKFSKVATKYWSTDNARKRAEKILSANYASAQLDAWLCSNDSTALGVIDALEAKYTGKWPIVTGQDCDLENVRRIIDGKQAMSVFKDTTVLAKQAVKMVGQLLNGKKPEVNDTESYDNGVKVVPAYKCAPVAVTKSNYKKVLIDSGFYTEDMLAN